MARRFSIGALALALAAVLTAGAAAAQKPVPKAFPYVNCAKVLPAAAANRATGGSLDLTRVTAKAFITKTKWASSCTYHSGTLSDPPAGAIGFMIQHADAGSKNYYATALKVYSATAAHNAQSAECQPGYDAASVGAQPPDSDWCALQHPFGAKSFQGHGYLFVLTPKYLVMVQRGGDGDAATVTALGKAVLARLH